MAAGTLRDLPQMGEDTQRPEVCINPDRTNQVGCQKFCHSYNESLTDKPETGKHR
jgi:hypothetical protein